MAYLPQFRPLAAHLATLACLVNVFAAASLHAQCSGSLVLDSQAAVDAYRQNHPNCTRFEGSIYIEGPEVDDLAGLAGLASVSDTLALRLVEIEVLDDLLALDSVGFLELSRTFNQVSLQPLNGLTVRGLSLEDVPLLNNLFGGDYLRSLPLGLNVQGNPRLVSLRGLDSLRDIGRQLTITGNDTLQNVDALERLVVTDARVNVRVSGNAQLATLEGLRGLRDTRGSLTVTANRSLRSLEGLHNLTRVSQAITIASNTLLTDLRGLRSLEGTFGSVTVSSMSQLTTLSGLERLREVGNNLVIGGLPRLKTFDGLGNVTELGGSLALVALDSITSMTGLEALRAIQGLSIGQCPRLEGLSDFSDELRIAASLSIVGNDELRLCAVPAVCEFLDRMPSPAQIEDNEVGCLTVAEVVRECDAVPADDARAFAFAAYVDADRTLRIRGLDRIWGDGIAAELIGAEGRIHYSGRLPVDGRIALADLPGGLYTLRLTTREGRRGLARVWVR